MCVYIAWKMVYSYISRRMKKLLLLNNFSFRLNSQQTTIGKLGTMRERGEEEEEEAFWAQSEWNERQRGNIITFNDFT